MSDSQSIRPAFDEVKQPKENSDQTRDFEVICGTTAPEITALKSSDLEPPNIFLACCLKVMRSYETLVAALKSYLNLSQSYLNLSPKSFVSLPLDLRQVIRLLGKLGTRPYCYHLGGLFSDRMRVCMGNGFVTRIAVTLSYPKHPWGWHGTSIWWKASDTPPLSCEIGLTAGHWIPRTRLRGDISSHGIYFFMSSLF